MPEHSSHGDTLELDPTEEPEPSNGENLATELLGIHAASVQTGATAETDSDAERRAESGRRILEQIDQIVSGNLQTSGDKLAALLSDAEFFKAPGLGDRLSQLRRLRAAGTTFRSDTLITNLDDAVVTLLDQRQPDLAFSLMSSHLKDEKNLSAAAERIDSNYKTSDELAQEAHEMIAAKRQQLVSAIDNQGLTKFKQDILHTRDPDDFLEAPPDDVALLREIPHSMARDVFDCTGPLPQKLKAADTLHRLGKDDETFTLLPSLIKVSTPEGRERYVRSYDSAREQLTAIGGENQQDAADTLRVVAGFDEPAAALEFGRRLYGDEITCEQSKKLWKIFPKTGDGELIHQPPDYMTGLDSLIGTMDELSVDQKERAEALEDLAPGLSTSHEPQARAALIAQNWRAARNAVQREPFALQEIAAKAATPGLAEALRDIDPLVATVKPDHILDTVRVVIGSDQPQQASELLNLAGEVLADHGPGVETAAPHNILGAALKTESADDISALKAKMAELYSNHLIAREANETYLGRYDANRQSPDPVNKTPRPPELSEQPEVARRLAAIGLTPDQAKAVHQAWATYDAVKRDLYLRREDKLKFADLQPHELKDLAAEQAAKLVKQVRAIENYAKAYGRDELHQVLQVFKIKHFEDFQDGQINAQVRIWNDENRQTEEIVFSSDANWNGKDPQEGESFLGVFPDKNVVFFGAGSPEDIADATLHVANRERRVKKRFETEKKPFDPDSVEFVVIHGHANPDGMTLGANGESLDNMYYKQLEEDLANRSKIIKRRPLTFRGRLGNKFRVIVLGCSAAGDNGEKDNITQTINRIHGTETTGPQRVSKGIGSIDDERNVIFNTRDEKGKEIKAAGRTYPRRSGRPGHQ